MDNQWIPTSEQLPELNNYWPDAINVIGFWGNKSVAEVTFCREYVRGKMLERWKFQGRICQFKITHWQYMPNPPKVD